LPTSGSYKNCEKCQFCTDSLYFKENTEFEIILKLRLDVNRKKQIAEYPFNSYVGKQINNYAQARGCMIKMEGRLIQIVTKEEFKKHLQDNVSCKVLRSLT
jgi:hypothetical protein